MEGVPGGYVALTTFGLTFYLSWTPVAELSSPPNPARLDFPIDRIDDAGRLFRLVIP